MRLNRPLHANFSAVTRYRAVAGALGRTSKHWPVAGSIRFSAPPSPPLRKWETITRVKRRKAYRPCRQEAFRGAFRMEFYMYMSIEERKKMQKIFEKAASDTEIAEEKKFFLTILSLIYELNEINAHHSEKYNNGSCCDGNLSCLKNLTQSIANIINSIDTSAIVDDTFMKDFTLLAGNLACLSAEINKIHSILAQIHAENTASKPPTLLILQ